MQIHWPAVFARVRAALQRRGRAEHEAEDIVQEAWLRLDRYQQDQPVERPEAFLMRTALNLSVDHHRAAVCRGEEVLVERVVLVDPAPGLEAQLLARERVARLNVCLGRLNEKTRAIFLANRLDGMTYQQIADAHGLSTSSVERHIAKATALVTAWMEGW